MKYYEILPTHTETPRNTTRKIANLYIEFNYHFLTLQNKNPITFEQEWTNSRKDEGHGVSPVKNSATIYFIICNPNNCPVKVKFYIIHIAYINFMQHGHSQTPSVHHCLQVLIDNNGDKFIRRSNICMSQFKLMVLVSNYIAKPKPLKCKQTWANVCYNTRK